MPIKLFGRELLRSDAVHASFKFKWAVPRVQVRPQVNASQDIFNTSEKPNRVSLRLSGYRSVGLRNLSLHLRQLTSLNMQDRKLLFQMQEIECSWI